MQAVTKLITIAVSVLLFSAMIVGTARGQRNPTMTEQQRDADREALFAEFSESKRVATGEGQRLAYEIAKKYLDRFGSEDHSNTRAVRKFAVEYERFIREFDIDAAYQAKNYKKVFEIGRVAQGVDAGNFFILATLVKAGLESAQAGNPDLIEETVASAVNAIKILETDQTTKPRPFPSAGAAQGFLNFALGYLLKDQKPGQAATVFVKALQADSVYKTDPAVYRLLGVVILKGDFAQLSAEYNEKFGNKPASAEQEAMLERIKHLADRAIDAYARAVMLTTAPQQAEARAKMLAQVTALYKNFHNNSDAGLSDLLATVLSRPLPEN